MGREFDELFNQWASTYDSTVYGEDEEYKEAFEHYEEILNEVAKRAISPVLEFGVGTGNLTQKMLGLDHEVIGIEPSYEMRSITKRKLPKLEIHDGDFLRFPPLSKFPRSIVSTYAFHHLTDEEKDSAVRLYSQLLHPRDRIVFADTMFPTWEARQEKIMEAKNKGYRRLENDLQEEYYPLIHTMKEIFSRYGFVTQFSQMNQFVWLVTAEKI